MHANTRIFLKSESCPKFSSFGLLKTVLCFYPITPSLLEYHLSESEILFLIASQLLHASIKYVTVEETVTKLYTKIAVEQNKMQISNADANIHPSII